MKRFEPGHWSVGTCHVSWHWHWHWHWHWLTFRSHLLACRLNRVPGIVIARGLHPPRIGIGIGIGVGVVLIKKMTSPPPHHHVTLHSNPGKRHRWHHLVGVIHGHCHNPRRVIVVRVERTVEHRVELAGERGGGEHRGGGIGWLLNDKRGLLDSVAIGVNTKGDGGRR